MTAGPWHFWHPPWLEGVYQEVWQHCIGEGLLTGEVN